MLAKHSKFFSLVDAISVGVESDATELRSLAQTGRTLAPSETDGRHREEAARPRHHATAVSVSACQATHRLLRLFATVPLQNVSDRLVGDLVTEVGQCAGDPIVSPSRSSSGPCG